MDENLKLILHLTVHLRLLLTNSLQLYRAEISKPIEETIQQCRENGLLRIIKYSSTIQTQYHFHFFHKSWSCHHFEHINVTF